MWSGYTFSKDLVAIASSPCSAEQLALLAPILDDIRAWSRSDSATPLDGGLSRVLSALRRQKGDRASPSDYLA
eukprot:1364867-Amphidinium_carterae.2